MSRIGKQPVVAPNGVTISVGKDNVVTVKGPKGELKQAIDRDITVEVKDGTITFARPTDQIRHRALHGLYRSLINNMVTGVSAGYKHELEIVGVGYKAVNQGNILELTLGYSHAIFLQVPSELKLATITEKGQNPKVILEGIDKQLIGQISAKIKSLRKVEPYKGKGIRFVGQQIRRKAGKATGKKK